MKTRAMTVVAALGLLVTAGLPTLTLADPPQPTTRLFLVLEPVDSTAPTLDETPGLLRLRELRGGVQGFGDPDESLDFTAEDFIATDDEGNPVLDLARTDWTTHTALVASSTDGVNGTVFVLREDLDGDEAVDIPEDGTFALTGPHGNVTRVSSMYATQITNSGDYNEFKWVFVSSAAAAAYRMDIYIGEFRE